MIALLLRVFTILCSDFFLINLYFAYMYLFMERDLENKILLHTSTIMYG